MTQWEYNPDQPQSCVKYLLTEGNPAALSRTGKREESCGRDSSPSLTADGQVHGILPQLSRQGHHVGNLQDLHTLYPLCSVERPRRSQP